MDICYHSHVLAKWKGINVFEKVSPSHHDKLADRIAGAIVDLAYEAEENPRIAVEVLIGHGSCHIIYESSVRLDEGDIEEEVCRITGIGSWYFDIDYNSQDVHLSKNQDNGLRCGDNGIFKGCPITEEQRRLTNTMRAIYEKFPYDGKAVLDEDRIILCQSHVEDYNDLLPFLDGYGDYLINPLGPWTGGPDVDTGATNRKLGSDMGDAVTGGGLCVSGETEYIGEDLLWHRIDEYDGGKVGQWNNGVLEFVQPSRYIHNEADQLIHMYNDTKLSMCLTPYHQMLIRTSKGNLIKRDAGKIADKLAHHKGNSGSVPHSFVYSQHCDDSRYQDENELRLQVAFCADGTIINQKLWTGRIRVKKQYKKDRLRLLLDGKDYKETSDGEYSIFWVRPRLTCKSLHDCFCGEELSTVYDEIYRWDGDQKLKIFRTTHREDADFAQFVIASQGKVATILKQDRVGQQRGKYTVKSEEYTVHELKSTHTALRSKDNGKGHICVEYLEDEAPSYCFEVPSHNLVLRHNGCVFVTGNCGKDLSKADVSVNIACHLLAQAHGQVCTASCAIGDKEITFRFEDEDMTITEPYENVVEMARNYVNDLGGFEKLVEWGLI